MVGGARGTLWTKDLPFLLGSCDPSWFPLAGKKVESKIKPFSWLQSYIWWWVLNWWGEEELLWLSLSYKSHQEQDRSRAHGAGTWLNVEPGMRPLQRAPGPFRDRTDTKLGTASRLYCWPGLALCDSSPHN